MKQKLLFLLTALLLPVTLSAESENVTVGDYSYTIVKDKSYAYVRGGSTDLTSIRIPSSITYKDITYTVVGINDMAFYGRKNVTSVSLPSTLRWIGAEAFNGCNISSLNIPNSIETICHAAFASCKALTTLSLPAKAITIQYQAFSGCSSLNSVELFAGSELQREVFKDCTSLTSIVIPKNVTLGSENFKGCTGLKKATILSSNTGEWTFSGCTSLTTVSFGNTVRTIDKSCFNGCTGLKSVVIRDQIETIGDGAFQDCSNLESITFGSGLKTLGKSGAQSGIVSGCTNLSKVIIPDIASWCNVDIVHGDDIFKYAKLYSDETHVINDLVIPEGVTTIKKYTFSNYKNLQSIQFPNTLETLCDYTFYGCKALESVKFGSGIMTIGAYAFWGCPSFSKLIIPDLTAYCGATLDIESNIFAYGKHIYCDEETEITELVIPDGTKVINDYVFQKCVGITSLSIPSSVETIGTYAFAECTALSKIIIGANVSNIGANAFTSFYNSQYKYVDFYCLALTPPSADKISAVYSNKALHVPENSLELYKEANGWKNFSRIVALQDGDPGYDELIGAVTLTANSYSRVYGDPNPTFEFEVTKGTIASGSPVVTCAATASSPVGTYDIVIEKGTVDNAKVYLINGTLTITPAPLTISAGNYCKVEGEGNPQFTPTFSGFKNNETKSVLTKQPVLATTATQTSPAGSYPVTVSGAEATNYDITYKAGVLTITSAAEVFANYITEQQGKADAYIQLISAFKERLGAMTYDEQKSLQENKDAVNALMNELAHDLASLLGVKLGDANGDGSVTVTDIGVIVDIILGNGNAGARKAEPVVEPQ